MILNVSDELLRHSVHNFNIVFLIYRMTLYEKIMMHYAIAIEENSEKILE